MARFNFNTATRTVIAARAGYRCSYPGCGRLTVGPAKSPDTFEDTGFASHIHSAAPNGPRGQGTLTPGQIVAAANGIWMCGDHETLIDKKNGVRFPIHILQSWKALHEYRTSFEHSGNKAAFGFVRRITIHQSPLFLAGSEIELAKTTFLIGRNGSGKTAVCEWLTALDTSRNIRRWLRRDLDYSIDLDAPLAHALRVRTNAGILEMMLDNARVSRNYARATTILLRGRGDRETKCDLTRIGELLAIEAIELQSLVALVSADFAHALRFVEAEPEEDEPYEINLGEKRYSLICTLASGEERNFRALSSGQKGRVLLEIAMTIAREAMPYGPVVLIAEIKSLAMDWHAAQPYLNYFASADCPYQTVITSWELPTDIEMLGWQIFTLELGVGTLGTIAPTPIT